MGMTLKNKVAIRTYLTVNDLSVGDVFVFNGDDKIYMMTDYDGWFIHLPSGVLMRDSWDIEWGNRPVTTINVDLIVK
jgi:hypothetical protein